MKSVRDNYTWTLYCYQAPQPPSAWEGVRDAASDGLPCVQLLTLGDLQVVFGFEDCLFLNVYTPKVSNNVMYL